MNPPNWKSCTEEELWRYVAWHLEGAGFPSVLVGGAVVAIYSQGIYTSGDLDIIPDDFKRDRIPETLGKTGFIQSKSRHFKHPDCDHLIVAFPHGPVEVGDEYPITPAELTVEGRTIRLLSPTDCVKDRLAAFIHWGSRDCFDQAVLVSRAQKDRVNFPDVASWCRREGKPDAFDQLISKLENSP